MTHEEVELWLDPRRGWCLSVPAKVPDSALRIMIAYALTMYEKQHKEMADGQRKRRLERAINDLIKLRVTQIIVKGGDRHGQEEKRQEGLLIP